MTIPRLYHSRELHPKREIFLDATAAHNAVKVLRLKEGDEIVLFNGRGGEYPARIAGITKTQVTVRTGDWHSFERESALHIVLAQGVSSADKMDLTVQKAVELGVGGIHPLNTQRSVVKLFGERAQTRVEHWRKVAIGACEQCGRNRIPEVAEIASLNDFLVHTDADALRLVFSPTGDRPLKKLQPRGKIILLIGAEGGFTAEEEHAARSAGFIAVTLGSRILRTETAGLAALAAIQTLWGDF